MSTRPNILFIMSDEHDPAATAIRGCRRPISTASPRAVRTLRWKYIRSCKADQPRGVDTGPAEHWLGGLGYHQRRWPNEMLYDLAFDPHEACNLAGAAEHARMLAQLRDGLKAWMRATGDPLRAGIPPPPLGG